MGQAVDLGVESRESAVDHSGAGEVAVRGPAWRSGTLDEQAEPVGDTAQILDGEPERQQFTDDADRTLATSSGPYSRCPAALRRGGGSRPRSS